MNRVDSEFNLNSVSRPQAKGSSSVSKKEEVDKNRQSLNKSSENDDFLKALEAQQKGLEQVTNAPEIKISKHASKRLNDRSLEIDTGEYLRLKQALGKLSQKGSKDSLVVTKRAAYIFDVPKKTLVTVMDKQNMAENIVTNIDSTMIVDDE